MNEIYERTPKNMEEAYEQIDAILDERIRFNNRTVVTMFLRIVLGLAAEGFLLLVFRGNGNLIHNLGLPLIVFNGGVLIWFSKPFGKCLNNKVVYQNAKEMIQNKTIPDPMAFVEQLKEEYARGVR